MTHVTTPKINPISKHTLVLLCQLDGKSGGTLLLYPVKIAFSVACIKSGHWLCGCVIPLFYRSSLVLAAVAVVVATVVAVAVALTVAVVVAKAVDLLIFQKT